MEGDGEARVLAGNPLELDVDDACVAQLVVAVVFGHGSEGGAAEVEVVGGHGVVVHVRDDHRLRHAGASRVGLATDLHGMHSTASERVPCHCMCTVQ